MSKVQLSDTINLEDVQPIIKKQENSPVSGSSSKDERPPKKVTISTEADQILQASKERAQSKEETSEDSRDIVWVKAREPNLDKKMSYIHKRLLSHRTTKLQAFGLAIGQSVWMGQAMQKAFPDLEQTPSILEASKSEAKENFGLQIILTREQGRQERKHHPRQSNKPATTVQTTKWVKKSESDKSAVSSQTLAVDSDSKKALESSDVPAESSPTFDNEKLSEPIKDEVKSDKVCQKSEPDSTPVRHVTDTTASKASNKRRDQSEEHQKMPKIDVTDKINEISENNRFHQSHDRSLSSHSRPRHHSSVSKSYTDQRQRNSSVSNQYETNKPQMRLDAEEHYTGRGRGQRHHPQQHQDNSSKFYDQSMHIQKKRIHRPDQFQASRGQYEPGNYARQYNQTYNSSYQQPWSGGYMQQRPRQDLQGYEPREPMQQQMSGYQRSPPRYVQSSSGRGMRGPNQDARPTSYGRPQHNKYPDHQQPFASHNYYGQGRDPRALQRWNASDPQYN